MPAHPQTLAAGVFWRSEILKALRSAAHGQVMCSELKVQVRMKGLKGSSTSDAVGYCTHQTKLERAFHFRHFKQQRSSAV